MHAAPFLFVRSQELIDLGFDALLETSISRRFADLAEDVESANLPLDDDFRFFGFTPGAVRNGRGLHFNFVFGFFAHAAQLARHGSACQLASA